ncbi:unnamed protein product [Oikopleura dioica]|uniref:Uncharacterized protein n=1 Tax=Oikopleura dioica TaxID=34765 RepID=E4XBW8_OIKDI|nr:unnamed protein product [Oikopleura dioica]
MRSVLSCLGIAFAIDTSLENAQCFSPLNPQNSFDPLKSELSGYLDDCFCQISELDNVTSSDTTKRTPSANANSGI